jgi:hypothetical protein
MVYKIVNSYTDETVLYVKGLEISTDGITWTLLTSEQSKIMDILETSPIYVQRDAPEIPDTRVSFKEYSQADVYSAQEAAEKAGFDCINVGDEFTFSCKCQSPLNILKYEDLAIFMYCPVCKSGIVNLFLLYILIEQYGTEIKDVDFDDVIIWSLVTEDNYEAILTKILNSPAVTIETNI